MGQLLHQPRYQRWSRLLELASLLVASGVAQGQPQGTLESYTSGGKMVTIELIGPSVAGKYPAVVLLHGSGGLEQATGDVFREIGAALARSGYVVAIPHYFESTGHVIGRPNKQGEYEAWIKALADAVDFTAKRPDVLADRIGIIGYSMGTNLAQIQAVSDPRIKAIVSCSGTYPPKGPNKKLPALLILHGTKDTSTPLSYVKAYQEALKANEMPHAVHIYKGKGHNFDIEQWADATERSAAFFDRYIKNARIKVEENLMPSLAKPLDEVVRTRSTVHLPGLKRHDGQPITIRQGDNVGLVNHDRLAGLDRQHPRPGLVQVLDRVDADGGHVEPHVLLGFGDLDQGPTTRPAKLAGSLDAAVGAFDRLDGDRRALLDRHGLTDVEPAHLLGQQPAELNIFPLARTRSSSREHALIHE